MSNPRHVAFTSGVRRRHSKVTLDIILPVFNEEEIIKRTIRECKEAFDKQALEAHGIKSLRLLFIDDGSVDNTCAQIAEEIENHLPARLIKLSRNFGHQNAVSAGLSLSDADLTAIMDGDLQDPPRVVLEMVEKWRAGFDVVYGIRRKRKESLWLVFMYWVFYRILAFVSNKMTALDSGDFCIMDRKVVRAITALPETLRFARGLRAWVGFRQCGHEYERDARRLGLSKYRLKDLYRLATDGIASVSIQPLKLIQLMTFSSGFIFGFIFLFGMLKSDGVPNVSLYLLISFLATTTNFSLYILAAYIGRTYLEVKARPSFIIDEVLGEAMHLEIRSAI